MKYFIMGLLCIALSIPFCATAQTTDTLNMQMDDTSSYTQVMDKMFIGLIANRIPYKVLAERAFSWIDLKSISPDTVTNSDDLEKVAMQLQLASYSPLNYSFEKLSNQNQLAYIHGDLILQTIQYNFASLDSASIHDGRLSLTNNTLVDNNAALPYTRHQVNLASFTQMELFDGQKYACSFSNDNLLCNTGNSIIKVKITNLANNETWELLPNEIKYLVFTTEVNPTGVTLKIERIMADGLIKYSIQQFVLNKQTRAECVEHRLVSSNIAFIGDNEPAQTTSHADYHIFYRYKNGKVADGCEDKIVKPIIICDGYDAGDTRNYLEIYKKKLTYLKIPNNPNSVVSIGDELRKKGYDVIILNFPILGTKAGGNGKAPPHIDIPNDVHVAPFTNNFSVISSTSPIAFTCRDGGADFIQRNAMLVVKLIQTINAEVKTNTPTGTPEKLVIVGPSMGGQVTRYALAFMEKQDALGINNMKHNCRQWVSFDSPHEGASIPMGTQCVIRWFAKGLHLPAANKNWNTNMMSPAFMQMVIEQKQNLGNYFTNGSLPLHQSYYNDLNNNGVSGSHGYPLQCRKINLSNGSGSGYNNNFPAQTFLAMDAWKYYIVANAHIWDYQRFMNTPNNSNKVYQFRLFANYFWFPIYLSHYNEPNNSNQRGTMDVVQGSTTPTFKAYRDEFNSSFNHISWPVGNIDFHSFIPTVSSMGFKVVPSNWHASFSNRNLLCGANGSETYFDNYYLPPTNEDHISFTENSYKWTDQEIDKGRLGSDCINPCNAIVTGNDCIKQNLTSVYNYGSTLTSINQATITTSANLQVINKTITGFTLKGLTPGAGWVKIVFENPCGANITVDKVVNVDLPAVPAPSVTITQSTSTCSKWWVQFNFGSPGFGTYNWSAFKSTGGTSFSGTGSGSCGFWILNGQNFGWSVSINNACGDMDAGQLNTFNVLSNNCGTGTYSLTPIANGGNRMAKPKLDIKELQNYSVHPNPTNNHWTIGILSEKVNALDYKLLNMLGQVIEENSYKQVVMNDFEVGNANLPKGLYLLKIKTNNGEETLKLLKE